MTDDCLNIKEPKAQTLLEEKKAKRKAVLSKVAKQRDQAFLAKLRSLRYKGNNGESWSEKK